VFVLKPSVRSQVTVWPLIEHVSVPVKSDFFHPVPVAAVGVRPVGNVSVTVTVFPEARFEFPTFDTVTVYVLPVSPWLKSPEWIFEIARSGVLPVLKVPFTVRFWSMVKVQLSVFPEQVPPLHPPKLTWLPPLPAGHTAVPEFAPLQAAYNVADVPWG
jgi:hypothetical protein